MANANSTAKPGKSKTAQAIDYLKQNPESSVYAAAKLFDIPPGGVYRRLKQEKTRCPCCGQIVKAEK